MRGIVIGFAIGITIGVAIGAPNTHCVQLSIVCNCSMSFEEHSARKQPIKTVWVGGLQDDWVEQVRAQRLVRASANTRAGCRTWLTYFQTL